MSRLTRYDPDLARLAEAKRRDGIARATRPSAGNGKRRAQAGRWWEDRLALVHQRYEAQNQAVIAYAPARVTPIRRDGRIVSVKMERGTVDYVGRVGDRPIAFDCKGCVGASWKLDNDAAHQLTFLRRFGRAPDAIAFFLIADSQREELLIVPQDCVPDGERVRLRVGGVPQFPVVPRATGALEYDYLPVLLKTFPPRRRVAGASPEPEGD